MAKRGSALVCVPCGREVLVTASGTAYSEIWCCGLAMEPSSPPKKKAVAGKTAKKAVKKKAPAKKKAPKKKAAAKKKAPAKKAAKKKAPGKKAAAGKKR